VIRFLTAAAVLWLGAIVAGPFLPTPLSALVYAIGSLICHQRPERSFDLAGLQLPVCARCLGIYMGAAIGVLFAPRLRHVGWPRAAMVLSIAPALLSLLIEWSGIARPGNVVRAATGLVAGAVIAAVLLATLHYERCAPPRPIAPNRPPTPI
jgi:uncharacterized membrane protein